VGFVALRALNVYGDPHPWSVQHSAAFTALSFLKCEKYPPSLLYLLMTLGPALCALAWFEGIRSRLARPLVVFGRVPLFFYVLHVLVAHGLALAVASVLSVTAVCGSAPCCTGLRTSLPVIYLVWLAVVVALYFPCRWFAEVKRRRRDWWLSYL
jgi:uncharacterized membrane protein